MARIRKKSDSLLRATPRISQATTEKATPVEAPPAAKKTTYRVVKRKRQETDDTGSWWDVAALPFLILMLPFRLLFSTPVMWLLGVALGLCLAPFIIAIMAIKALAVVALLGAFLRPRSS